MKEDILKESGVPDSFHRFIFSIPEEVETFSRRKTGLLTHAHFYYGPFPCTYAQWVFSVSRAMTVAGAVPDSNRIPY